MRAVLTTLREAVGESEFAEVLRQLSAELQELAEEEPGGPG